MFVENQANCPPPAPKLRPVGSGQDDKVEFSLPSSGYRKHKSKCSSRQSTRTNVEQILQMNHH